MSLRQAAEMALSALEYVAYGERPPAPEVREAIATLRHVLAETSQFAALAEADEPVAWFESPYGEVRVNPLYKFQFPSSLLWWQIPLYTHPPRREPLTEEEVRRLYREAWTPESEADEVLAFARAIERAHGIGTDE